MRFRTRELVLLIYGVSFPFGVRGGWIPAPEAAVDRVLLASAFAPPPVAQFTHALFQDRDGDGDLDAWFFSNFGATRYANVGTPHNPVWQRLHGQVAFPGIADNLLSAHPADVDLDGRTEFLVVAEADPWSLRLIHNTSDATTPAWEMDPDPVMPQGLAEAGFVSQAFYGTGDLDGDGRTDLLVMGMVEEPASGTGHACRVFRSEIEPCPEGGCWSALTHYTDLTSPGVELAASSLMEGIQIVDLNGDGAPELVVAGTVELAGGDVFSDIVVVSNAGTPESPAAGPVHFGQDDPDHPGFFGLPVRPTLTLMFGDIDGDGDPDLYAYEGFFRNQGTSTEPRFSSEGDPDFFGVRNGAYSKPLLTDLNGDGAADLLLAGDDLYTGMASVTLLSNLGTPFAAAWSRAPAPYGDWMLPPSSGLRMGDVDGDGDQDAWFGDTAGLLVSVRSGTPDAPMWSEPVPVEFATPDALPGFYWGEVDAEPGLELIMATQAEGLLLLKDTADAAPPEFSEIHADFGGFRAAFPEGYFRSPVWMDVDGDGRNDLATLHLRPGEPARLLVARGTESGLAAPIVEMEFEAVGGDSMDLGDLNGDGLPDLMVGGLAGGVQLFLQSPDMHHHIRPSLASALPGQTISFEWDGPSGAQWSILRNGSGGTLDALSGHYEPGPTNGVDVIEARFGDNFARAYVNVIPAAEAAAFGKAILIAGSAGPTDPAWPATDRMSRKAYDALRLRGYTKDNILFLNFEPGRDLDGNGLDDDIDGPASAAAAAEAFTSFATNASRLVVGLWDHGATGGSGDFMRLNPSETLSAAELDGWLDAWQAADTNRVCGLLLEFCQSGAFLDDLARGGTNRIVAASCATNQLAYFIAGGLVSFSERFFSGVIQGLDFAACFQVARSSMDAYQSAQLDDDGDGVFRPDVDGAAAANFSFGASYTAGRDVPQIAQISPNQTVGGSSPVTLWAADIASPYAITRVWAVVVPPTHQPDPALANPVTDLPEIELSYNPNTSRYEGDFEAFTEPGSYAVIYFAEDAWGGVSVPRQSYITQDGLSERVILVGGQSDDPVIAAGIEDATRRAYATLRARRIPAADIRWLSASAFEDTDGDTTNEVHAAVSTAALQEALTLWAAGVDRLNLLIIAEGTNNQARLSGPSDLLEAATLKAWLDAAATSNQTAQILLDFSGSGAFIPVLNPAPVGQRMVMASTAPGRFAVIEPGINLTSVIMSEIFSGRSVGDAVSAGRKVMRRMSGGLRQVALLDSDGDGVSNQKNVDDPVARAKYLGAGFVTGDDNPVIGRVTPDLLGGLATQVVLFAESVIDADGIDSVWAEIAGPDSEPGDATRRVNLLPDGPGRWAATDTGMVSTGLHAVAFFADDVRGNRSAPVLARIERVDLAAGSPPDAYEIDDDSLLSRIVDLPMEEIHTLHVADDEDWVRFYASSSLVYDIATTHLTNTVDTVLEIYSQSTGGVMTLIDRVDDFGPDEGEWTGLDFPDDGIYAVRVTHATGEPFSPGAYELSITVPAGLSAGITVLVVDVFSELGLPGATVNIWNAGGTLLQSAIANSKGLVWYTNAAPARYLVEVIPPAGGGYKPFEGSPLFPIVAAEFSMNVFTRDIGVFRSGNFFKASTVTGIVESASSGAGISGASIRLVNASEAYAQYPVTSVGIPWRSAPGGAFPDSVIVHSAADYSIEITAPAYEPLVLPIGTLAPGETRDLGALALVAADLNNNQVPDPWEFHWFNGLVDVDLDPDLDRASHRAEYIAGTNPTLPTSTFRILPNASPAPFLLTWQPVAGRRYRIHRMTGFPAGTWMEQYLSPVAGTDPPPMEWTDPAPAEGAVYRIDAELP